jgi:RNA polymerase sigma factor (sigma-70 family)
MAMFVEESEEKLDRPGGFHTTHWSQILALREGESGRAERALATLCETYWIPLYTFVCRKGYDRDEAQDLTQSFFARLLAGHTLEQADPGRGRFRTYLLNALEHFLTSEWRHDHRQKRGGSQPAFPVDPGTITAAGFLNSGEALSPELSYDRHWAMVLLQRVIAELRSEYQRAGKIRTFELLQPLLTGEDVNVRYRALGESLGITEANVKVHVYRLRRRFGELLRAAVAQTVARAEDVEDELRHLLSVVAA